MYLRHFRRILLLVVASLNIVGSIADAGTILPAFVQTSSNGNHNDFAGTRAVVSDYYGEDHRGIAEFDITALTPFSTASLTFNLFTEAGAPLQIDLSAYHGDGLISLFSDFSVVPFSLVSQFSNGPYDPGDPLTFDITAALNAAVLNGDTHLGIRLQRTNYTGGSAYADFRNFRIETTEISSVPEPSSLAIFGIGAFVAGAGALRRRREKRPEGSWLH